MQALTRSKGDNSLLIYRSSASPEWSNLPMSKLFDTVLTIVLRWISGASLNNHIACFGRLRLSFLRLARSLESEHVTQVMRRRAWLAMVPISKYRTPPPPAPPLSETEFHLTAKGSKSKAVLSQSLYYLLFHPCSPIIIWFVIKCCMLQPCSVVAIRVAYWKPDSIRIEVWIENRFQRDGR